MDNFTLFTIEMGLAMLTGVGLIAALQHYLKLMLTDLCGTEIRARFWVRISQLMMLLAPLMLTALFSAAADGNCSLLESVRRAILLSFAGGLSALAIVARFVWSAIPTPAAPGNAPTTAGSSA